MTTDFITIPSHSPSLSSQGRTTGLEAMGRAMVLLGVLCSTWTSVVIRGQMVSDLLLYGGALLAFAARPRTLLAPRSTRRTVGPLVVATWAILAGGILVASSSPSATSELSIATTVLLSLVGLPIVALVYCRTPLDAVRLVEALIASLAVNGLLCLATNLSGYAITPMQAEWNLARPFSTTRLVGLTGHPNMLGYAAAATLPMVPMLWRSLRQRHSSAVLVITSSLAAAAAVLSGSRGGALGVLAGCAAGGIMGGTRHRVRWLLSAVPAVVVVVVVLPNSPLATRILGSRDAIASDEQRREGISEALSQLAETFPTGKGLRTLATVHSGLLALLLGAGILMSVGVIIWGFRVTASMRSLRRHDMPVMRDLGRACTASAVGSLCYLATSPFMYHRHALLASALAIALESGTRPAAQPRSAPDNQRPPLTETGVPRT